MLIAYSRIWSFQIGKMGHFCGICWDDYLKLRDIKINDFLSRQLETIITFTGQFFIQNLAIVRPR